MTTPHLQFYRQHYSPGCHTIQHVDYHAASFYRDNSDLPDYVVASRYGEAFKQRSKHKTKRTSERSARTNEFPTAHPVLLE